MPASAARDLSDAFRTPVREHGFTDLPVIGDWPRDLRGTLYRNGPGLFENHGRRYGHWFDGDALVVAARMEDGRVQGALRVLDTPGLLEERRRGRAYFGGYGTRAPGGFNPLRALRTARGEGKNPSNTSMMTWGDRVFALCEAGRPLEIDPDSLATLGESTLEGALPGSFSAHPHRRASDGALINIGVRIGRPTELDLVLLRTDGSAGRLSSVALPYPTMVHDFALTERHAIVFLAPLHIDLVPLLFGRRSFVDAHRWVSGAPTEVLVFSLDAPATPIRFAIDPFWAWHVANAFDDGDRVVVDLVRHEDYPTSQRWLSTMLDGSPGGAGSGQLARLTLDPKRADARSELLRHRTGEFPRVAPGVDARRHRFIHLLEHASADDAARRLPNVLVRFDAESGVAHSFSMGEHEHPSEPVFVPRGESEDEARGYVLTLVYDARERRSRFVVFDAERIEDGPLASASLPGHVPPGFHGVFRPAR